MITFSYGGGKQSVGIICMILEGALPVPDMILIADTGREVQTTWDYMDEWVQPALETIGRKIERVGHEYSTVDIQNDEGAILLPAFTRQSGNIGKLPTYCSNEWKQRPIRRYLREQGVNDTDIWLGISTDEAERMKPSGLKWYRHEYPLIDLRMSRQDCVNAIMRHGWPVPNKSRCWMCPNQSSKSWQSLKRESPGEFEQAVKLEAELRERDKDIYLHNLAVPLEDAVKRTDQQPDMFDACESGYCFV